MKRARLAFSLALLMVGCVDEDTNSATGSFLEIADADGGGTVTVDDAGGRDGVIVDCSALVTSNISVANEQVSVRVSFPADTADGARFELPTGADVTVTAGAASFEITSGAVIVDVNDPSLDIRIAVTLEQVTALDGRVLSGTLDCLETNGDILLSSCASACAGGGGGGGGGGDFDD